MAIKVIEFLGKVTIIQIAISDTRLTIKLIDSVKPIHCLTSQG